MDIPLILSYLRPGEEWSLDGEEYSGLIWHSNTVKPTEAELFAAWDDARYAYFMRVLRNERNILLMQSDWTQVEDAPVDKAAWAEYRQALRDLPENTIDPENPVWPTPPA